MSVRLRMTTQSDIRNQQITTRGRRVGGTHPCMMLGCMYCKLKNKQFPLENTNKTVPSAVSMCFPFLNLLLFFVSTCTPILSFLILAIIFYPNLSHPILLYSFPFYPFPSYHLLCYPTLPFGIIFYAFPSYLVLPFSIPSFPVLSFPILRVIYRFTVQHFFWFCFHMI